MQEILDGWMFQPGKVRGVRWTIHNVEQDDGVTEAIVLTTPVFQLLAGAKVRSVSIINLETGFLSDVRANSHGTGFFYVARGIVKATTEEPRNPAATAIFEQQVLYPAHGVVVPAGVGYAFDCLHEATIVYVCDEDEPSEPDVVATYQRWV